jgi:sec-independent protein translocase protein TatA
MWILLLIYFFVVIFAVLNYINMIATTIFLGELLSPGHIILILAVVLLLFGGKKIPELMKGLGSGIKEFKNAAKEDSDPTKKNDETK